MLYSKHKMYWSHLLSYRRIIHCTVKYYTYNNDNYTSFARADPIIGWTKPVPHLENSFGFLYTSNCKNIVLRCRDSGGTHQNTREGHSISNGFLYLFKLIFIKIAKVQFFGHHFCNFVYLFIILDNYHLRQKWQSFVTYTYFKNIVREKWRFADGWEVQWV